MGFEPRTGSKVVEVADTAEAMAKALDEAWAAQAKAKDNMAKYYNRRRLPMLVFQEGDKVYLDSSDIKMTRPSKKFSH